MMHWTSPHSDPSLTPALTKVPSVQGPRHLNPTPPHPQPTILVTSGGQDQRPFFKLTHLRSPLVLVIQAYMMGEQMVRILLECFLVMKLSITNSKTTINDKEVNIQAGYVSNKS